MDSGEVREPEEINDDNNGKLIMDEAIDVPDVHISCDDVCGDIDADGDGDATSNEATDDPDEVQPLSERWSPLGANYDDANSRSSCELLTGDIDGNGGGVGGGDGGGGCDHNADINQLEQLKDGKMAMGVGVGVREECANELARLRNIEEEQELLSSSLLALTSHFAHVQLRVRQIVEAPTHERDQLLRDLEEFAFQGIPDAVEPAPAPASASGNKVQDLVTDSHLIEQLKLQLTQMEQLAYEAGAPGVLPQHVLLEKQQIILDELRVKLNLQLEQHELPALSTEQLRHHVDNAIGEFVGPLKMKEQLVAQLKTQITDLERFIAFLHNDDVSMSANATMIAGSDERPKLRSDAFNTYAAKQTARRTSSSATIATTATATANNSNSNSSNTTTTTNNTNTKSTNSSSKITTATNGTTENATKNGNGNGNDNGVNGSGNGATSLHSKAHGLLDKASLLMQMFASTHLARRQTSSFQQNSLKKTRKGNHWGDLRAQLEVDIQEVAALAATLSCDREKLANIKRALQSAKENAAITAQSGALIKMPPRCRRPSSTSSSSNGGGIGRELTSYHTSAHSSSDSDEDACERYDWDKTLGRRIVHVRGDSIATINRELTTVVRKNFARTLQQLMQHGLRTPTESATSSLMVPFMRCLHPGANSGGGGNYNGGGGGGGGGGSSSSSSSSISVAAHHLFGGGGRAMHAWELILEYYHLKQGDEYNNTPARKLSQSFQLDIVDAKAVTAKESLLSAVGMIVAMHQPYKRSHNAHFKAFVSAGLNARMLVEWLNLMLSCNKLIDTYYAPNSYVARTGFRDSLRSIDTLSKFDFDLPIDLAVRHFRNI